MQAPPIASPKDAQPEADKPGIHEIEDLYLNAIASVKHSIYIELQYFCANSITRAIERRLAEPDIVVINPHTAQNHLEDQAMHVTRRRMVRRLRARDPHDRFRIFYPVTDNGEPIYVHAKIMIVDNALLRVESSNLDHWSRGFDTECDMAIGAPDDATRTLICGFRNEFLAEHLCRNPAEVTAEIARQGNLVATLDRFYQPGGAGCTPCPCARKPG